MSRFTKYVFVFFAIFSLAGCSHFKRFKEVAKNNYNSEIPLEEQLRDNAVVVCKAKNEEKVSRGKYWFFYPTTYFTFETRQEDKFCIDDSADQWSVKLVRPGVYRLSEVSRLVERTTSYWYDFDYYFYVGAGEVVYLDDLSIYPSSRKVNFINNFEQAMKFISKIYPALAKKLKKKSYVGVKK